MRDSISNDTNTAIRPSPMKKFLTPLRHKTSLLSIAPLFILQFDSMSYIGEDERQSSLSANLIPNMFLPADKREGFATEGYISLGHTYRSRSSERTYRYRVSDRTLELIR